MTDLVIERLDCIWSEAQHSAFTDLLHWSGQWWCTFREAADHGGGSLGAVRILRSQDGSSWQSVALLVEEGFDLRDPKLSAAPDGRLVLVMGASVYRGSTYLTRSPRVAFSVDGHTWSNPTRVLAEDHWLWRITWHAGRAYAVSKLGEGNNPRRGMLYASDNAVDWRWICEFYLPENTWNASETTLRFTPDEELIALVRPEWIGRSRPPYTEWSWTQMDEAIGGPNFVVLPDGAMWGGGRRYVEGGRMWLARMTPTTYEYALELPSGGDCSYPGMVWHGDRLWVSYYSAHEGKAKIYLARVAIE